MALPGEASRVEAGAAPLGRTGFSASVIAAIFAWWLGQRLADAALPAMARLLNPFGINAGLAYNVILLVIGGVFLAVLARLIRRRFRDAGLAQRHDLVVVAALAGAAVFGDHVFLWSHHLPMSAWLAPLLLWLCLLLTGAIVAIAALLPHAPRPVGRRS
jgi:hypothetical protein